MKHALMAMTMTAAMLAAGPALAGDKADSTITVLDDTTPLTKSMSREPIWYINLFGGQRNLTVHPEENYTGVRGEWRGPDAMDYLENELRRGYAMGARSFWVNRPMGTDGLSHPAAGAWLTIPEYKRGPMEERINNLILDEFDEPVKIYYYIGTYMEDPRSIRGWMPSNADEVYRFGDDGYEAQVATRATLGGLMSAGAAGFAMDGSALTICRDHYMELADQLRRPPFNLEVIGEALPVVPDGHGGVIRDENGDFEVDEDSLERMAWVGTERYLDYRFKIRKFDPDTTRVIRMYERKEFYIDLNPAQRREMVRQHMLQGYIVLSWDDVIFQAAMDFYRHPELLEKDRDDRDPTVSTDPIPRRTLVD